MTPCPTCGAHVRPSTACPTCGAPRVVRATAVAVLLGLAACAGETTKDESGSPPEHTGSTQVDYGVPTTYTDETSGTGAGN